MLASSPLCKVLVTLLGLAAVHAQTVTVTVTAKSCAAPSSSSKSSATSIAPTTSQAATTTSKASTTSTVAGVVGTGAPKKPTLQSNFIYDLDNSKVSSPSLSSKSGVNVAASVYIVDGANTSKEQIKKYKDDGKTVVCYFSAGSWEPGRSDSSSFDPACVCGPGASFTSKGCSSNTNKMDGWNEWWINLHSESCLANIQNVMTDRIIGFKEKGCDGLDPDNVDSWSNGEQKHGNTIQDQSKYLLWLSQLARSKEMLIGLKNAGGLLQDSSTKTAIVNAFDFSVIEQCHDYDECDTYDAFLAAGKPEFQIEYGKVSKCPSLKTGQHMLVYSEDTLDTSKITLSC